MSELWICQESRKGFLEHTTGEGLEVERHVYSLKH